ncbi:MAG: choice-of-anchor B family protein, partial [Saprospiraceae bacterium]
MQSNWFSKAICFLLLFNFHYLNAQDCIGGMAGGYPCSDIALRSEISLAALGLGEGNDIWGWQSPDTGREYAIVGGEQGTAFIDVTDAANAWIVGRLARPGSRSFWRDMKVLDNYVYLGSEGSGSGMQVFDLTELDAITTPPSSPPIFEEEDNNTSDFISTSHNIIANPETGLLMAVGTNRCSGGLVMYDVAADPTDPPQQSCFSADGYTHDAVCFIYRGMDTEHIGKEICIAFNEDTYTIVDVTDRNNPVMISRSTYSNSAYSHQGWITDDHRYLVLNDENDERLGQVSKTRTMFFDLADLDAPTPHMTYFANSNAIDHNLYIRGNYVYQANYKAGVRILDISDLANQNVTEVAYFDIFPANDRAEFSGAWSIYPYFDNNKLLVSSILEGFYALEFDADHFFIRKTGTGIVTVPQNSSQNYDIELV